MSAPRRGPSTIAVHGVPGRAPAPDWPSGMSPPIFQSATYDLDAAAYEDIARTGGERTWWYSRLGNPTVAAVAAKLAALEQAEEAVVLSSGMAAIATTLLALLPPGGRVVAARELYGDVVTLLRDELPRHGRSAAFVAVDDLAGFRRELAAGADLLYVETLSNPMLRVADVGALSAVAREAGALSVVDATFTPPVGAGTLALGADLVVHSATKYLNGHSDLVAGVVAGRAAAVAPVRAQMAILGGCLDPHAAFLLDRGLKTLAVRVARHQETALALARRLAGHPEVEHVAHPGLPDHPDHALAARALPGGCGLVTIRVRGGDERARRVLDALRVVRQATSLGGVESLASTPHNTSHLGLDAAARAEAGILPGTIRLSVGLEELADLAGDLEQALAATAAVRA